MKVSEKGAVSVYGMGRFPVTLYKEQWLKLLNTLRIPAIQADAAEQAAWRSSGERQTGPEWHLLGPPIRSTLA